MNEFYEITPDFAIQKPDSFGFTDRPARDQRVNYRVIFRLDAPICMIDERATGIEPAFRSLPLNDTLSRGKMNVAEYS